MARLRTALTLWLLIGFSGGCATTAFTQTYKREHALADDDLKRVRFYISSDLVLQRKSSLRNAADSGAFPDNPTDMVQEIVIPKGTRLVLLKVVHAPADAAQAQTDYLQLGLAADAPAKSLWFSTLRSGASGRYELTPVSLANETAAPVLASEPAVRYDGFDYRLRDEGMWHVFLCVGEIMQARVHVHGSVSAQTH